MELKNTVNVRIQAQKPENISAENLLKLFL